MLKRSVSSVLNHIATEYFSYSSSTMMENATIIAISDEMYPLDTRYFEISLSLILIYSFVLVAKIRKYHENAIFLPHITHIRHKITHYTTIHAYIWYYNLSLPRFD